MPRILYVSTVFQLIEGFLLPHVEHFRNLGWEVDGMAAGISGREACQRAFDQVWDVSWSRSPLHIASFRSSMRRIREVVEREKYDIVHVHTPIAAFVTRFALRQIPLGSRPVRIYTAHGFHFHPGGNPVSNAVYRAMEKLGGRWTDHLILINRADEEATRRLRIAAPERTHYIPGVGLDTSRYAHDQISAQNVNDVKQSLGMRPEQPLFLMIAEFNPGKRHRDLLRAFARCGLPDAHVALAGVGRGRAAVEKEAAELGVSDRVHFLGFRRDIPTLLRASTALVLPSEREGLSRSVQEALALETPVIGADVRGIRELAGDGCGYLVPVGNHEALAKALREVTLNPMEARARTFSGRLRVQEFELRQVLSRHEQLYNSALGLPSKSLEALIAQ
jgi:glycosyltransferase involved in cell wall biosynthesis